jgi:threonine 3-dehydrogenase
MVSLLQAGMNVTHVLTHRFRAEQFEEGFEAMNAGNCAKVILDWTG